MSPQLALEALTASLASAQQRIEELERALRLIVDRDFGYLNGFVDGGQIRCQDIMRARAALAGAALSKAYLSGVSPQSAWPFEQDESASKSSEP